MPSSENKRVSFSVLSQFGTVEREAPTRNHLKKGNKIWGCRISVIYPRNIQRKLQISRTEKTGLLQGRGQNPTDIHDIFGPQNWKQTISK